MRTILASQSVDIPDNGMLPAKDAMSVYIYVLYPHLVGLLNFGIRTLLNMSIAVYMYLGT